MTAPEEGVEQLDVRTKWPHEALDFTPWLAKQENLDLLGAELGLSLECAQTEVQVGSMYLDILAKERDTGALVAIENQLEETDLGHLGQLLTYATGHDARVAIWVAPAFYHEYAQALHKLNQWTATPSASTASRSSWSARTAASPSHASARSCTPASGTWTARWRRTRSPRSGSNTTTSSGR